MQGHNTIDIALHDLAGLLWLDGLCAVLSGLHRKHARPDVPASEISRSMMLLPFLESNKLNTLGGYESLARDTFNDGVKAAYRCVGWKYVGLLSAVANETRGAPEWNAYYSEAVAAIEDFFKSGAAWQEFDSHILEPAERYLK